MLAAVSRNRSRRLPHLSRTGAVPQVAAGHVVVMNNLGAHTVDGVR